MTLDLNTKQGRKQAYRDLTWGDHGFLRLWFNNHRLIGRDMYRANQPSPKRIEELAKDGINVVPDPYAGEVGPETGRPFQQP